MKVLVIPSWYPPNGGGFFVDQSKWLIEAGINIEVLSLEDRGIKQFRISDAGKCLKPYHATYLDIPTYRKIHYRIPFLIKPNIKRWISQTLGITKQYIDEYGKPDLIHVHSCMWAGIVAARIKSKFQIPYLITEHRGRFNKNSNSFRGAMYDWHIPLLREALLNADRIIPVSANMIPVLEKTAAKKLNCLSIPNPVDEILFKPLIDEKREPACQFISISVFTQWKSLDILIKAFHFACKQHSNLFLHLVGQGPDYRLIQQMVKELGLMQKVVFHGMLEKKMVHSKLSSSDFMVLSSSTEGQPVVVGESILCGVPVITTDVVTEEDVPGFAGMIVRKQDPEALGNAMVKAASNRELYDSERIRRFGMERFSKQSVIKKIIAVMEEINS